jgi:RNA-binding protein 5/10
MFFSLGFWYSNSFFTFFKIKDRVKIYGAVLEVRLIRDKVTGDSRGFAFIDFSTQEEAKSFLDYTKGTIEIDGVTAQLDYSREKTNTRSSSPDFKDWVCPTCQGSNFARRKSCYSCQTTKPDAVELSTTSSQEKNNPCSVLIIRGLDPSTSEKSVRIIAEKSKVA